MFERFDSEQLLAYIEGELDADEAAALERELAESPQAALRVASMRRDREMLRAEPEPALPRDFLPSIESRLARPMLMETLLESDQAESDESEPVTAPRPGAMRRQQRRRLWRARLTRLSLAGAAAVAVFVAGWVLITSTSVMDIPSRWLADVRSAGQSEHRPDRSGAEQRDDRGHPTHRAAGDHSPVHHALPHGGPWADHRELETAVARSRPADSSVSAEAESGQTIVLPVMLHVRAAEMSDAEAMLVQAVQRIDGPIALVQNFNYDEATRLAEAWRAGQTDRGTSSFRGRAMPPAESFGNGDPRSSARGIERLADHAQQEIRRSGGYPARPGADDRTRGGQPADDGDFSRPLIGFKDDAPPFSMQLDLSSRGATHTFTIPADRLQNLLEAVSGLETLEAVLRELPSSTSEADEFDSDVEGHQWLVTRRQLQHVLDQITDADPGQMIHLAVRITSTARRR